MVQQHRVLCKILCRGRKENHDMRNYKEKGAQLILSSGIFKTARRSSFETIEIVKIYARGWIKFADVPLFVC